MSAQVDISAIGITTRWPGRIQITSLLQQGAFTPWCFKTLDLHRHWPRGHEQE